MPCDRWVAIKIPGAETIPLEIFPSGSDPPGISLLSGTSRAPVCHRAALGNPEPFASGERLPAEVPAGLRPARINGAPPRLHPAAVRRILPQVPAGRIREKTTIRFLQSPLAEIAYLVGLALLHKDHGKPSAALATTAAGAGRRGRDRLLHDTGLSVMGKKDGP